MVEPDGIEPDDLKLAKLPLSQLSYGPQVDLLKANATSVLSDDLLKANVEKHFSLLSTLGPASATALVSFCKAEVNWREPCIFAKQKSSWWAWEDLNFRPHAYQARALTN